MYPVDVFKHYLYAIDDNSQLRDKPPKAVNKIDGGHNIGDWTSYAVARYRAIELANGDGLMNDPTDVEKWRGADASHPNDNRKTPLIWE
eukprot:5234906-Heterocapsa_arctica.AAC.1